MIHAPRTATNEAAAIAARRPTMHGAPSRRQVAMGVSIALAAAVNAAAIGVAERWSGVQVSITAAAGTTTHRPTALFLVTPAAASSPSAALRDTGSRPIQIDASTPAASRRLPLPAPAQPLLAAGESAPEMPAAVRFYTFTEVDRPAAPQTDWPLDVQTLEEAGIERLVFEVMVNDRGDILGCAILHPVALNEAMRIWLEQRLGSTPMQPAMRDGQLVASVRRIELQLEAVP